MIESQEGLTPMTVLRAKALLAQAEGKPMAREDSPILTTRDLAQLARGWLRANDHGHGDEKFGKLIECDGFNRKIASLVNAHEIGAARILTVQLLRMVHSLGVSAIGRAILARKPCLCPCHGDKEHFECAGCIKVDPATGGRVLKGICGPPWPCLLCPPHEHQGDDCDLCKPHEHTP